MLKGIMKYQEFSSSDEIEEAIRRIWDGLTFENVESVRPNWVIRLAWVIENGESVLTNKKEIQCLCFMDVEIGGRPGLSLPLY
jgi:hypothetical protein